MATRLDGGMGGAPPPKRRKQNTTLRRRRGRPYGLIAVLEIRPFDSVPSHKVGKTEFAPIPVAVNGEYAGILESISAEIKSAQARAMKAANSEPLNVYKGIGEIIFVQQSKGPVEREFYITMPLRNGWSSGVVAHDIEGGTFEATMVAESHFKERLPTHLHPEVILTAKDEYALDFLGLAEPHSEREFERAILRNLDVFLREVGPKMPFVHSRYRIAIEG
ncbi:MAG: PDDEXK nuclease domain-containing protein [Simkaniaceae bacterium]|nr:PDDEXK nuclease domain-containing protein [Simkaniaceae bacterium]